MKLLLTADAVGGIWNYAVNLARALQRHDAEVVLATMGEPPSPAQRDELRCCRNVVLREAGFRLEWMADPWDDVARAGEWLLELERSEQPDVVHLNGFGHGVLPFDAPVLVAAHSCVFSWWHAVHGCAPPAEWDRYREWVAAGLRGADLVVAPTRWMLDSLAEHYGAVPRARVVRNGCDADALPLGARDAFGRYARRARLPEPIVLAVGRIWDESKNLGSLAAAAPALRWPVCIAGADTSPAGARRVLEGVHCLGVLPQPALRRWYERASIFVHPSLYEPFGLAPLEAATHRCALVLGDIPSLREVWQDAAVYVPPREPAAIAAAVNSLAAQPLRHAAFAEAARQRASALTARRMARDYVAIYQALAHSGRSQPAETATCA
jgi:glycogen synthase